MIRLSRSEEPVVAVEFVVTTAPMKFAASLLFLLTSSPSLGFAQTAGQPAASEAGSASERTPPAQAEPREEPPAEGGSEEAASGQPSPTPGLSGASAAALGLDVDATEPSEAESSAATEETKEPEPVPAPKSQDSASALPRNTTFGHLFASVRGGLAAPFGKISRGTGYGEFADAGWGFGADVGLGVGRDVVVGAYGDLLPHGTPSGCADCSPLSIGAGLFVRYHLVQGLSFDPWASYGIGYRSLDLTVSGESRSYAGLEWLRITFGGDFYPSRFVGFGPYLELGAGSFFSVPEDERPGGVHYRFQTGLRISVDLMGR